MTDEKITFRTCWDEEHSWENFLQCIIIFMPRPLFIFLDRCRHPGRAYRQWRKERWIKSCKIGDEVCSCFGHVTIVEWDPSSDPPGEEFIGSDGMRHDLFNCCSPIDPSGHCHASPEEIEEANQ